jgi:hypothetical protein
MSIFFLVKTILAGFSIIALPGIFGKKIFKLGYYVLKKGQSRYHTGTLSCRTLALA